MIVRWRGLQRAKTRYSNRRKDFRLAAIVGSSWTSSAAIVALGSRQNLAKTDWKDSGLGELGLVLSWAVASCSTAARLPRIDSFVGSVGWRGARCCSRMAFEFGGSNSRAHFTFVAKAVAAGTRTAERSSFGIVGDPWGSGRRCSVVDLIDRAW